MLLIVAAIAYENAFPVNDSFTAGFRVIAVVHWIIFPAPFERYRQTAGRIHVSKKYFGQCRTSFLTWIPGFDQTRNAVDPVAHVNAAAGCDRHDDVAVDIGEFTDQLVLTGRKTEGSVRAFAFGVRIETDS